MARSKNKKARMRHRRSVAHKHSVERKKAVARPLRPAITPRPVRPAPAPAPSPPAPARVVRRRVPRPGGAR